MKLINCHIESFGCLRKLDLEFGDGVFGICQQNGTGKTTFAAFIRAMLYGLPTNKARKNARKQYEPWGGSDVFGGSLGIETSKGRYTITRVFGKTVSGDKFTLKDMKTNLESRDYSENIGVELFGLDEASFEKSTFMPHEADTTTVGGSQFIARLTGLLESSEGNDNFDAAVKLLEDVKRRYENKNRKGQIADIKNDIENCKRKIVNCENALTNAVQLKKTQNDNNEKRENISREIEILKERLAAENKNEVKRSLQKTLRTMLDDAAECNTEYKNEKALLESDGKIPDTADLRSRINVIERLINAETGLTGEENEELSYLSELFGNEPPSVSQVSEYANLAVSVAKRGNEIADAEKSVGEMPSEPKKKNATVGVALLIAAAVLCAVTGAVLMLLGISTVAYALLAVSGVSAVVAVMLALSASKSKKEYDVYLRAKRAYDEKSTQFTQLKTEYDNDITRLDGFVSRYYKGIATVGYDNPLAEISKNIAKYRTLLEKRGNAEAAAEKNRTEAKTMIAVLRDIFGKYKIYGDDLDASLSELERRIINLGVLKENRDRKAEDANDFAVRNGLEGNTDLPFTDIENINSEIEKKNRQIKQLDTDDGYIRSRIEKYEDDTKELPYLRDSLTEYEKELENSIYKNDIAENALEFLKRAKTNLASKYIDLMENGYNRYFREFSLSGITVGITAELETSLTEKGEEREIGMFSTGIRAISDMCMRLALADALYPEDERPFIVLDDPFSDLDDEKLVTAKNILKKLSSEVQIIYLTCYSGRSLDNQVKLL